MDEPELSLDEVADLWRTFRERRCSHCGGAHARACPKVRKFEFHQNGNLQSVEFWAPGQWSDEDVQWPETLPPEAES